MTLKPGTVLPAAFETLHVGVGLYHPDTARLLDVNERFTELFDYPASTLRGFSPDRYSANTFSPDGPQLADRVVRAAEGEPQTFRWRVKRGDGELIWTRFHLRAFDADGRSTVLAEVHDITDHHVASRRVDLLARVLRHNVRNDVNVIAGRADRIAEETTDERLAADATLIRNRAMGFAEVSTSMKRIERAATETNRRRQHATEALTAVAGRVGDDHPNATVVVAERDEMWVETGRAFDHALGHAIDNALRHAETPSPRVTITVGASPNTGRVEIGVVDDNAPIPRGEIDALDAHVETTETHHGSGVGLFVMKWCIEALGGELRIEATESGNDVRFYLPPKEPPADVQ